ncbi:glycoside hydrolase family 5 protein [Lichenifustis flavocetrariae]|uniref:Glycoside hydrolase family 5 protein n=1 Tax=Lichenifustis flavocetrariae TaxID=2949735 RepID=A0AA42CQ01_9HYPH|nr:cellulase family glycosylhydrolase [Lichenifustis flavocetrariae]MCW6510955.1 glycoside hydrolase family 5 protein [Lichenifustis flavocetrariae]
MPITALMMRRRGGAAARLGSVYDLTPKALPGAFKLGVNMSGPESGNPYPSVDMLTKYAAHGMSFIRQPLGWNAMQPTLGGAISTTEFAKLSAVLAMCKTLGITVLIDANHTVAFGAGRLTGPRLGSTGLPISYLADYWTKLLPLIMADPSYSAVHGYSPINEPNNLDPNSSAPSTPYSQNLCFQLNQQVLTVIRNAGDTKPFYVAGDHYQGAWDWVVNNAAWFLNLVDPANALVADVHCYLDGDSSGSNYTWAQVLSKPDTASGQAPPGLAPNVNIGPQRLSNVVAWAYAHGVKMALIECGWGFDAPYLQAGDAMTAYVQACNMEFTYWSAGYNFSPNTGYYYDPDPYVPGTNNRDFSPSGVPSPQSAVLQKYAAAPTAYPLFLPVDGSNVPIRRGASGVASSPFKILFGGNISSPITITPHAKTADGTDLGWTFTPSSVVMAAGQHINEQLSFTATPTTATAGVQIGSTNNGGLADPALLGFATAPDSFIALAAQPRNIFGLRRLYAPYIGPAIRLRPPWDTSGNSDMDFPFNNRGDLPRQAIQDWASSRTIAVTALYDQEPAGNHLTFGGTLPSLLLADTDGYPSISVASGCRGEFNMPGAGQTGQTVIADLYETSNGPWFVNQNIYSGPFTFSASTGYTLLSSTTGPPSNLNVSVGGVTGQWHEFAGTAASGVTGGLRGFKDGALVGTPVDTPPFSFTVGGQTEVGFFKFASLLWTGKFRRLVLCDSAISDAQDAVGRQCRTQRGAPSTSRDGRETTAIR